MPAAATPAAAPVADAALLQAVQAATSLVKAQRMHGHLAARLANSAFTDRAKPEAVEKARADHDSRAAEAERLGAALARLG